MRPAVVDVEDVQQPPLESASVYNEEREFLGERLPSRSELSLLSLPVEARVPNSLGSYYFPREATQAPSPVCLFGNNGISTGATSVRRGNPPENATPKNSTPEITAVASHGPAIAASKTLNNERHSYFSFAEYIAAEVPIHYQKYYIEYEQCKDLIRHMASVPEALRLGTFDINQFPPKVRRLAVEVTEASLLSQHVPNMKDDLARNILPQAIFREFLMRQLNKINQFAAERYNTIQQEIRNLYREIQHLISTDQARFELHRSSSGGSTITSGMSEPSPSAPNLDDADFSSRVPMPSTVDVATGQSDFLNNSGSAIRHRCTIGLVSDSKVAAVQDGSQQAEIPRRQDTGCGADIGLTHSRFDWTHSKDYENALSVPTVDYQQLNLDPSAAQLTIKIQREGSGIRKIASLTDKPTPDEPATQSADDLMLSQTTAALLTGQRVAPSSGSGVSCSPPSRSKSAEELHHLKTLSQNSPTLSSSVFTPSFKSKALISESEYSVWRASALANVEQALDGQSAEIIHLDMFVRINFKGLLRLCGIFDKVTVSTVTPWLTASIMLELFANLDLDRLLVFLSVVWDKFRVAVGRSFLEDTAASTWVPPESFIRNTTKYWVRPDQVVRLKVAILKHMPYLIFGRSTEELEAMIDPYSALPRISKSKKLDSRSQENPGDSKRLVTPAVQPTSGDPNKLMESTQAADCVNDKAVEESQLVSSIYLDSPDAYCYNRRILRMEGAQLVRFRWYADNTGEPDKPIFVERKTHHESWSGDKSSKDRFCLPQCQIFGFLKHRFDVAQYLSKERERSKKRLDDPKFQKCLHLGNQIQSFITEHKLQPMVRTSYQRAAFQLSSSNAVRFSLDCNLCMVDEYLPDGHPAEPWCRLGEEICGKEQVVRFPYAVLEVKLQTEEPPWVSKILADVGATMVYKFSKFQHGMAFLHRNLTEPHGMPHWIHEFEKLGFGSGYYGAASGAFHDRRDTLGAMISPPLGLRVSEAAPSVPSDCPSMQSLGRGTGLHGRAMVMSDDGHWTYQLLSPLHRMAEAVHFVGSIGVSLMRLRSPMLRGPELGSGPAVTEGASASTKLHRDASRHGYQSPDLLTPARSVSGLPPSALRSQTCHRNDAVRPPQFGDIDATSSCPLITSPATMTLRWLESKTPILDQTSTLQWIHSRSKTVWKMDPKSSFAAERTFLHYAQKGVFLAGLSVALVSFGNTATRGVGIMLSSVCISVFAFSYNVFHERLRAIERRRTKPMPGTTERLDSTSGPIVLIAVVSVTILLAVLANFIFGGGFYISNKFPAGGKHHNRHVKALLRGGGHRI